MTSAEHAEKPKRVVEGDGHRWTVTEAEYPTPSDPVGRCLIFNADYLVRRIRKYPADWYDWSDEELYRLSLTR